MINYLSKLFWFMQVPWTLMDTKHECDNLYLYSRYNVNFTECDLSLHTKMDGRLTLIHDSRRSERQEVLGMNWTDVHWRICRLYS